MTPILTLKARIARLEAAREAPLAAGTDSQVLIVDAHDGRMTNEPLNHSATTLIILHDNGRDDVALRIWGDIDYAIDWHADDETRQAQTARQCAHLLAARRVSPARGPTGCRV